MVKPEILTERPIPMFEVLSELEKIKKKEKELNFRSKRTEEYLQQFVKKSNKKNKEFKEKIEKLKISRLKQPHIIKIVDLLPDSIADLKSILQGYTITIKNDDMKRIVGVVKDFEKASEKLTSEHLRESKAPVNKNTIISMDRFATYAGSGRFKMTRENEEKIDKMTGLIRKGVTVQPGETMAAILRKRSDDPELKLLGVLTKSSVGRYKADPITWNRDASGEVVGIEKNNKDIQIAVKTEITEPSRYSLGV